MGTRVHLGQVKAQNGENRDLVEVTLITKNQNTTFFSFLPSLLLKDMASSKCQKAC